MAAYELIVFDWDGTLMDSTALIASSLQAACRDVGAPVPSDLDARFVIGLSLADTLKHVAPGLASERQGQLVERYRHHFLAAQESPLFEGIPELLAELRSQGRRLAVATGKARRGLDRALASTGLGPLFEATQCADEGFAKPHPGMLHALLDCTGVDPGRAVMVGDTTHDLELAANAGIDAIAVLYGAHHPELLDTRGAIARCASVAELRQCLLAA
jgi:phosphoglycolate phosphatase